MNGRGWTGLAAAGLGAAGAVAGGMLAGRRVAATRRAGLAGAAALGGLRGDPAEVRTDDGVLLHAETDAPDRPGGATVVLVHGYALNLDCWHFQREHLRGRHRLVLFDQRSHGRSERSDAEHATIDQLGEDLRAVLDRLVPDGPVVLVGHSMGGMTILAFAERHPEMFAERVTGVALFSTAAGGLRAHRLVSPLLPDAVGAQLAPRLVAGLARSAELVDRARERGSSLGFWLAGRFAFGGQVPAPYVEFVDRMLSATPFEVVAQFFPAFDSLDKYDVLRAFAQVPALVLCGTRDLLTPPRLSRAMASRLPQARLLEVPGAGHMVILERHVEVNAALDRLLERAGRDAAEQAS